MRTDHSRRWLLMLAIALAVPATVLSPAMASVGDDPSIVTLTIPARPADLVPSGADLVLSFQVIPGANGKLSYAVASVPRSGDGARLGAYAFYPPAQAGVTYSLLITADRAKTLVSGQTVDLRLVANTAAAPGARPHRITVAFASWRQAGTAPAPAP